MKLSSSSVIVAYLEANGEKHVDDIAKAVLAAGIDKLPALVYGDCQVAATKGKIKRSDKGKGWFGPLNPVTTIVPTDTQIVTHSEIVEANSQGYDKPKKTVRRKQAVVVTNEEVYAHLTEQLGPMSSVKPEDGKMHYVLLLGDQTGPEILARARNVCKKDPEMWGAIIQCGPNEMVGFA